MGSFEDFCVRIFHSTDGLWLVLPFVWQGQMCFPACGIGIVHGSSLKKGAKVDKSR